MTIPDLLSVLGRGQNFIIVELWVIGYLFRLLPPNICPNSCIPGVVVVFSFILSFMLIQPFKDAFLLAPLFACIAIMSYEPIVRRVQERIVAWFKKLMDNIFGPEDPPLPPDLK